MIGKKKQKVQPVVERRKMARYLYPIDVWAIAFGCSVGWGVFVMPGTTFLPIAGPAGTVEALILSTILILVIGFNYGWLMKNRPRKGGVYSFTKEAFGRDHAFLCSWFLSLSYLTIVFLNATALFIISRVVLADNKVIGASRVVFGHSIYPGEIALSVLVLAAVSILLILNKPFMQKVQTILAIILMAGIVILSVAALRHIRWGEVFTSIGSGGFGSVAAEKVRAGSSGRLSAFAGILTLMLLAPWAFVGFEVVSLETPHFDFPIRWSWKILVAAILSAGFSYIAMSVMSITCVLPQFGSWQEYFANLDFLDGIEGVPTFYTAQRIMGKAGVVLITVTALAAILTGVIGAYRATIRMLSTMAEDKILAREFNGTTFCIVFIMGLSSIFTFLGRSTLNWFVDLTSLGATICFAYTSAAAWKIARREGNTTVQVTGILGAVTSSVFMLVQLASRIGSVETMCAPSFLLLSVWCLLGFLFYWRTMRQSDLSDFDGVTTSSIVLFCLLFYSILMWFMKKLGEAMGTVDDSNVTRVFRFNGTVMLLFVIIGLIIMMFTQRWLRHRHARLEREKMQAEESSKAKSQFLFNMSHDIRTPMNAIVGYTHLAGLEENVPPKVREYIEKIDISGKHLLTLINDVLEMSRIESGRMELLNEPGDICEALQTAYEMFREQMEEKKIRYTLNISKVRDRWVVFDRNRFLRVVLNLVSNAYKFTPDGGHVKIRMTQIGGSSFGDTDITAYGDVSDEEEPEWGAYEIRVKDDGIGMTPEFAEMIFEVFARERTSTVSRIQGTGLGMAITKSIVDAMQGSIDVITAPEKGTEIVIRFPFPLSEEPQEGETHFEAVDINPSVAAIAEAESHMTTIHDIHDVDEKKDAEHDAPQEVPPGEGLAEEKESAGKRVLVTEDMEINRQILEILLQNLGYDVETASDGKEAVDKIEAAAPGYYDAVLMDIQMPVMDGYEATEAIRNMKDPGRSQVPIVAVTANAFGEDVRKAREKGMNGHISKPIDPEQLMKTLNNILQ